MAVRGGRLGVGSKKPVIFITAGSKDGRLALSLDYLRAVSDAGGVPVILPAASGLSCPDISQMDGLLIPGGGDINPVFYGEAGLFGMSLEDPARTEVEINIFREIIETGKPALGICYGMQLMNVALGGTLYQDIGSQIRSALNHRETHDIALEAGPFKPGVYAVNSSHHQAVKALAPGLEAIAESEDGVAEAFCMRGHPFLVGVEWHPERMHGDALAREIFRLFVGAASGVK